MIAKVRSRTPFKHDLGHEMSSFVVADMVKPHTTPRECLVSFGHGVGLGQKTRLFDDSRGWTLYRTYGILSCSTLGKVEPCNTSRESLVDFDQDDRLNQKILLFGNGQGRTPYRP